MKKEPKFLGEGTDFKLALALAFVFEAVLHLLLETLASKVPFLEANISWLVYFNILLAIIISLLIEHQIRSKNERAKEFQEFKEKFEFYEKEEKPLIVALRKIVQNEYPDIISEKLTKIQTDLKGDTHKFLNTYFENWNQKIKQYPKWRLIFERLVNANKDSVEANKFSVTLRTYLWSLLDIIDVMMLEGKANGVGLVIHSYTNAIPNDWEDDLNPLVGENMEEYSNQLVERMNELKKDSKNSYKRFVLCSDKLSAVGIKSFDEVKDSWNKLTSDKKNKYLDRIHTSPDDALIANLRDDVKFKSNYTEIIYFGFSNGNQVDWEFCFCCGYTNNNLNITASFFDLNDGNIENIIETANIQGEGDYGQVYKPSPTMEYTYQQFPEKISQGTIAKVLKFKNLTTLAEKWDLASSIWHNKEENEELLKFLINPLGLLPEHEILDCACGTGEHSFFLKDKLYNVKACDVDPDNINKFKEKEKEKGVTINPELGDWLTLDEKYKTEKFDFVLCLGSSITYYESWKENLSIEKLSQVDKTEEVLVKLKSLLKPDGKLVIGVSRHYDKRVKGTTIDFKSYPENAQNGQTVYDMSWRLDFDWKKEIKYWTCKITSNKFDDYSFELVSHLYDIKKLIEICEKVFPGAGKVRSEDIDKSSYDLYIICSM